MSKITIADLEVYVAVGVSDAERATPQRLLITVDMSVDFGPAALSDRIERTINYHDLSQDLLKYGDGRSWKLIEKLAVNMGDMILAKYRPLAVQVEIKKFVLPQARHVSVTYTKARPR